VKRFVLGLAGLGLVFLVAGVPAAKAQSIPESTDPIVLSIHEWTGQQIAAYIAGHVLERMGYNVEYITAAVQTTAYHDSSGPNSRLDAHYAIIVGGWEKPSRESRIKQVWSAA
jgi:ABC-type proline/glycine betaine transport system substrate-binding protein